MQRSLASSPDSGGGVGQRVRASISACMRALYSSDQCAPGLSFAFACCWGTCGAFFSTGGRRAAVFNFKVVRGVVELEDELESLMQVFSDSELVVARVRLIG